MAGFDTGMASYPTQLSRELRGSAVSRIPLDLIDLPENRQRKGSKVAIKRLAESLRRHGQLQPICCSLKPANTFAPTEANRVLVFGAHRLFAFRQLLAEAMESGDIDEIGRWSHINTVTMSDDFTDDWALMHEIAENLVRKELSTKEKAIHRTSYAGLVKQIDERLPKKEKRLISGDEHHSAAAKRARKLAEPVGRLSETRTASQQPYLIKETIAQAVRADLGVPKQTLSDSVRTTSKLAGEDIDLEKDSGAEIIRKADKAQRENETAKKKQVEDGKAPTGKAVEPQAPTVDTVRCDTKDPKPFIRWLGRKLAKEPPEMSWDNVMAYDRALREFVAERSTT